MESGNEKCVMIIDDTLPLGIIANTAGILGISLGKHIPKAIGPDIYDKNGNVHCGIITIPVPILKAGRENMREIREQLYRPEFSNLIAVDFSDVAQSCNVYDEYSKKAAGIEENQFRYFGIGIYGSKKLVNTLTGNLPLLR